MDLCLYMIFGLVSFCASVAGAICGIGGGVLIKPVLDTFHVLNVSSISFLSGCTVLSMSCYSIVKARISKTCLVDKHIGFPLAAGAALGGTAGKIHFSYLSGSFPDKNQVGGIQAACLLVITFFTMVYTLKKDRLKTYHITSVPACGMLGIILGMLSSFLGIGGGPINLAVFYFFFSMDAKTAAQNSLYIIVFSQTASLIHTLASRTVPVFEGGILVLMVTGGILGGIIGRIISQRLENTAITRLFVVLMNIIMLICVYNVIQFL